MILTTNLKYLININRLNKTIIKVGVPQWTSNKESACNVGDAGLILGSVEKIPWRRQWQPNPVPLPGKSHGQRSLVTYSS